MITEKEFMFSLTGKKIPGKELAGDLSIEMTMCYSDELLHR